jgi:hypothetical protein
MSKSLIAFAILLVSASSIEFGIMVQSDELSCFSEFIGTRQTT